MKSFVANDFGRLLFIHLSKGEDILKSITEEVRRQGIKSGIVVSGIGALRKATYHYIGTTEDLPTNMFRTIDKPLEMSSLQGLILEGVPHLHITFSEESQTYAGHLEEGCEVQYLAEIAILEVKDLPVGRRPNAYGVYLMEALAGDM